MPGRETMSPVWIKKLSEPDGAPIPIREDRVYLLEKRKCACPAYKYFKPTSFTPRGQSFSSWEEKLCRRYYVKSYFLEKRNFVFPACQKFFIQQPRGHSFSSREEKLCPPGYNYILFGKVYWLRSVPRIETLSCRPNYKCWRIERLNCITSK